MSSLSATVTSLCYKKLTSSHKSNQSRGWDKFFMIAINRSNLSLPSSLMSNRKVYHTPPFILSVNSNKQHTTPLLMFCPSVCF